MPNRAPSAAKPLDSPKRRGPAQKRQPAVARIVVAVLAGSTLICVALIIPILWTAITDTALRPSLTYDRCGTVQDGWAPVNVFRWRLSEDFASFNKSSRRMMFSGANEATGQDGSHERNVSR